MSEVPIYLLLIVVGVALGGLALYWAIHKHETRLDYSKQWSSIKSTFREGSAGQKLAVSDADKLLDQALRAYGFAGETMGERLKSARPSLGKANNSAWSAHKIRNKLAHEANFTPTKTQCHQALQDIEQSLRQLGVRV